MSTRHKDPKLPKAPKAAPALLERVAQNELLGDIRSLIEKGRQQLASVVNCALTVLYWQIGKRIRSELLKDERAAYGEQIVSAAQRQLRWTHFKALIYVAGSRARLETRSGEGA